MTHEIISSVSYGLVVRKIGSNPSPGGLLGEGPRKVVFRNDT